MANADPKTQPWPVRLPPELLRRWRALAGRDGLTAAGLLRRVMVATLDGQHVPVGVPDRAAAATAGRLSVTLHHDELARVREAAQIEGHSLAGWIRRLIRARLVPPLLDQRPQYTPQETEARLSVFLEVNALRRQEKRQPAPFWSSADEQRAWEVAEKARLAKLEAALGRIERQLQAMHTLASERARRK